MESVKIAQFIEISAGQLVGLSCKGNTWRFLFSNGLEVESYAGWNLLEHDYGAKLLIGYRDLAEETNPLERMREVLGDATCEAITFNSLNRATQLQFLRDDDRLSLDLLSNSATSANWKIAYDGQEEFDIE